MIVLSQQPAISTQQVYSQPALRAPSQNFRQLSSPEQLFRDRLVLAPRPAHGPVPKPTIFDPVPAAHTIAQSKQLLDQRRLLAIQSWANKPMEDWTGWKYDKNKGRKDPSGTAKGTLANRAMSKLALGVDTERVNQVLLSGKPYSGVGTHFAIKQAPWIARNGDYDFALRGLTALTYTFWDSPHLKPETKMHLATTILNQEGNDHLKEKWLLGFIPETENHLLMTETSRYLKNQLVHNNGIQYSTFKLPAHKYDNSRNGFNEWMVDHLSQFVRHDFDEYNSKPYQGYTVKAIQNMYEFADDPNVKKSAQIVLDYLSARFATQSNELRRVVPFRRRQEYSQRPNMISTDSESARYALLAGNYHNAKAVQDGTQATYFRGNNMLIPSVMSYRVPDAILDLMIEKGNNPYFMTVRHENTEIFYSEKNFMISAGGHYHKWSNLPFSKQENGIPMPTVVMLKNGGPDINNMLRFLGRGDNDRINNTGVYENFAFGIRPVLPENMESELRAKGRLIQQGNWTFMEHDDVFVALNRQSKSSPRNYAPSVGFSEIVDKKEFQNLQSFMQSVLRNNQSQFNYYGHNHYTTTRGKTIEFEMAEPLKRRRPPKPKEITEWKVKKVWNQGKPVPIESNLEKWPLIDSHTMNKEYDGNDYVVKADKGGQILINNPHRDESLLMSLADQKQPIRIEQQGEIVDLVKTSTIQEHRTPHSLDLTVNFHSPDSTRYVSLPWKKGSQPQNVQVFGFNPVNQQWFLLENRQDVYKSGEHQFRSDFDLPESGKVTKIHFRVHGRHLNLSSSPEVYQNPS